MSDLISRESLSNWWALVMETAASFETASYSINDIDAKKSALGAIEYARNNANKMWENRKQPLFTTPQPTPSADDVRDAERYRYLRDCGHGFDLSVREETEEGEIWVTGYPPDELNKAIDQAIAVKEGE